MTNKELHENEDKGLFWQGWLEDGDKMFHFPGISIPEGFYHGSRKDSISFWFRNNPPAISLCVVSRFDARASETIYFPYELIINGNEVSLRGRALGCVNEFGAQYHTTIFDLTIGKDIALVRSEITWYCAEIRLVNMYEEEGYGIKQVGMRVLKHRSSMEDISFTIPRCMRGKNLKLRF